ncbi:synaptobrevin homolog YKT6 [Babesia ovis]|uniref:Synaptobrevin homolog YKT6 n=1 Tax=Babesia ovis TaxID=5869 RepID=A0A9W5WVX6_BABOV|nr:synaptobrevin homolog YKT6 [Babesia ovis]
MADGNIMYIGYVDVPTKTVLASYPRTLKRGTATFVEEALANVCEDAMETATNKSIKKLEFNYETVYYKADDEIKGVVVAMIYEENYPERFVYTLIQEIWREINMLPPRVNDAHGIPISMQKKLGSPMIRIFKRYDNVVEVDHAVRAKMQIDEASYAVGDSMKKIIGTCANLEELKSKSLKLKNQTVVVGKLEDRVTWVIAQTRCNKVEKSLQLKGGFGK